MNEKAPFHYQRLILCSDQVPLFRDKNAIYLLKTAENTVKVYPFTFTSDKELKTLTLEEYQELQATEVKFPSGGKELYIERVRYPERVEKIISICGLTSLESDMRSLQAFHDWGTIDAAAIIKDFAVNSIDETKNLTDSSGYDLLLMSIQGDDLPRTDTLKPPTLIKQQNSKGDTQFYIYGFSDGAYKLTQLTGIPELNQLDFSAEKIFISPEQYKEIYDEITLKNGHIYSIFHKFTDWFYRLARAFHPDKNREKGDQVELLCNNLTQLLLFVRKKITGIWENNEIFDLEEIELAELYKKIDKLWNLLRETDEQWEEKFKVFCDECDNHNKRCDKLIDGLHELAQQVKLAQTNEETFESRLSFTLQTETVSRQELNERPTFLQFLKDSERQDGDNETGQLEKIDKLLSTFENFCHLVQEATLNSELHREVEQVFVATDTLRTRLNQGDLDKETANSLIIRLEGLIEWLQELVKELKNYVNNDHEDSQSLWQKTTQWFQALASELNNYVNSNYSPSFWQQPIVEASLGDDEELSEESDDSFELKF